MCDLGHRSWLGQRGRSWSPFTRSALQNRRARWTFQVRRTEAEDPLGLQKHVFVYLKGRITEREIFHLGLSHGFKGPRTWAIFLCLLVFCLDFPEISEIKLLSVNYWLLQVTAPSPRLQAARSNSRFPIHLLPPDNLHLATMSVSQVADKWWVLFQHN